MLEKYDIQKLQDLPIEQVAEALGLQVSHHKALCPFHADKHPSLTFHRGRNRYRCFVCDARGGVIDLVMHYEHKSFLEACQWLADKHSVILTTEIPSTLNSQPSSFKEPKPFDASRYERFFERPFLSEEARRFLFAERKLDPRVIRWCRLSSWKDRQGTSWLQIPYYDREGKLIGIQNRNLAYVKNSQNLEHETWNLEPKAPRFRFPQGAQCSIYNLPVLNLLKPGETLFIAEGSSDCWSLLSSGHQAIAIPSATLLSRKDKELLASLSQELGTKFAMYPDQDLPGERLCLQLQQVLPSLVR
jgi:DNA primase